MLSLLFFSIFLISIQQSVSYLDIRPISSRIDTKSLMMELWPINQLFSDVSDKISFLSSGMKQNYLQSTKIDVDIVMKQISDQLYSVENILTSIDISKIEMNVLTTLPIIAQNLAEDMRTIPIFIAIVFIMVIGGFGQDDSKIGSPFTAGASTYDFNKSELFYSSRPLYVFRRLVRLARITSAFNIKLLLDWKLGNIEKYENERAAEALTLVTQLGPTFIKLGQALSIRTDLIPKAYALELRTLQDAVPPFDSVEAKKIIQEELGVTSFSQVFSKISEKPVSYNDGIIRSFFNRFLLLYVDRKC
jgi:hypothetical protein